MSASVIAVDELVDLMASSHARWTPQVVTAIFGTDDPGTVAALLTEAVSTATGSPVTAARFYEPGVGVVVGFELADGRAIVVKAHRAAFTTFERLAGIAGVQAALVAAGLPAPAPIAGPVAFGHGWLTIEEHRGGETADGCDPAVRRNMASTLHDFIEAARPYARGSTIGAWLGEPVIDDVWPEPHDLRFDFPGTTSGAAWIDDVARAARGTLTTTTLPDVVGHLDWRVQNLAFAGTAVCAIYDWDSLRLVPEAAAVGAASATYPVDWRLEQPDPLPTLDELDGFVVDYEAARGAAFSADEHTILAAAQRWVTSYGARCQHSDDFLGLFPDVDHSQGWPRLLHQLLGR